MASEEGVPEETKTLSGADGNDREALNVDRFSDVLTSRIIEVTVGFDEKKKTFLIHEDLLCRESDKMNFQLRGPFKEAQTGKIPDCDEDPALFAFFTEYLYRDGWVRKDKTLVHSSEWVLLARLYAMGERLGAKSFQDACLWKFLRDFTRDSSIPDSEIVQLLEIITELPERNTKDDPLRSAILWYAASKLSRLQKYSAFKNHLLSNYPDLGGQIVMWAADSTESSRPVEAPKKPDSRFHEEVEFV
ncbi:hypothetical protein IWZ00DRAFT_486584 [Phyllosticta capitalensis]|uniref:BTB domain-containing protein n=1 Tax=Phyllosticta capitalensis TaxID=121624 RepID=A0ABR1YXX4_9PEZI